MQLLIYYAQLIVASTLMQLYTVLMIVMGIETSCDESAVALYSKERGVLIDCVHSQIDLHRVYGGVVPEIAARDHVKMVLPLVNQALSETQTQVKDIAAVAYTAGPGLVGALLVGATTGRSLAYGWGVPAIGVHHMEAHLMAVMLDDRRPSYPFVALLVSGGHTMLVAVEAFGQYRLLGESLDDAVGEAFDKTAKLLGLPYPGGPAIEALAKQGEPGRFTFPRPMVNRPGCDFSYSGLKTFAVNTFNQNGSDDQTKADIALAFQTAAIDTLIIKSKRALQATGYRQLAIVGGVSANQYLRERSQTVLSDEGVEVFFPKRAYCTDNGAMVAYTGFLRFQQGANQPLSVAVKARWPLEDLNA